MSKIFISEVCIKLEPFVLISTQEVARSFKKVGDPCSRWTHFQKAVPDMSDYLNHWKVPSEIN